MELQLNTSVSIHIYISLKKLRKFAAHLVSKSISSLGVEYTFKSCIVEGDVNRHCGTEPRGSSLSALQSKEVDSCNCKL